MFRRISVLAGLAMLVLGCVNVDTLEPVTTQIAPSAQPSRWTVGSTGFIKPQANSNLCVDITGGAFVNGTLLQLYTCNGSTAQQWSPTSDGEYRTTYGLSYCLDTQNASTADGTKLFLWNCYGSQSQHWTRTAANEIKNYGGKCVQYVGTKAKAGVQLEITTCNGSAKQKWTAPPIPADTVTPPPPVGCPPTAIAVNPGQSIQAASDANPSTAVFCLKTGTHLAQSVKPKAGQTFIGEAGTVLDGQGTTAYAFRAWNDAGWVNNVTLRNFRITNYVPAAQRGAVWGGDDVSNSGSGWVLDTMVIDHNQNLGVRVGHRMKVLNSKVTHNSTINIGGAGTAILVENSDFSFGNEGCPNTPDYEAGGSKFAKTDSLVVRNSIFTNSCGPGLWLDIDNKNYILEGNRADSNSREGIVVEVSYQGIIRNNTARHNGYGDPFRSAGWCWGAGIGIHPPNCVEVYGKTRVENWNGIMGVQQKRDSTTDRYGPGGTYDGPVGGYVIKDLYVHNNSVSASYAPTSGWGGGGNGICRDQPIDVFSSAANNRFLANTYNFTPNYTYPFAWADNWQTLAAWQGYGNN